MPPPLPSLALQSHPTSPAMTQPSSFPSSLSLFPFSLASLLPSVLFPFWQQFSPALVLLSWLLWEWVKGTGTGAFCSLLVPPGSGTSPGRALAPRGSLQVPGSGCWQGGCTPEVRVPASWPSHRSHMDNSFHGTLCQPPRVPLEPSSLCHGPVERRSWEQQGSTRDRRSAGVSSHPGEMPFASDSRARAPPQTLLLPPAVDTK